MFWYNINNNLAFDKYTNISQIKYILIQKVHFDIFIQYFYDILFQWMLRFSNIFIDILCVAFMG